MWLELQSDHGKVGQWIQNLKPSDECETFSLHLEKEVKHGIPGVMLPIRFTKNCNAIRSFPSMKALTAHCPVG